MALSEHELRVLREIEQELQKSPPSRRLRLWTFVVTRWPAVLAVVAALAATVLLAAFAPGAVAAPLAVLCGALAGFHVRTVRRAGH